MCNYIFHFSRELLGVCFLLSSLSIVGCASADVKSPSDYKGYTVCPYRESASGDVRWAEYLKRHLERRGGKKVPVEYNRSGRGLFRLEVCLDTLSEKDFCFRRNRDGVRITARNDEAMLWLQYQFMKLLGNEDTRIEASDLPPALLKMRDTCGMFAFSFRGIYSPAFLDEDYAGIVSVHQIDREWGLWGHQLKKAIGSDVPDEVFAVVNGKKYDEQYCFSSEELYLRIERYINDNFGARSSKRLRFMIAPNDNVTVCTCEKCRVVGNTSQNGTPAVVKLVERLARRFPDHRFYMLAYLATFEAPAEKLPGNAGVVLSAMELPLRYGGANTVAGRRFVDLLERWKRATNHILVWDYINNFDDYLTPFPVLELIRERLLFYREHGVQGVFLNGSGDDYCAFDDMRSFVLSALLLDPGQSVGELMRSFFADRYPVSGELLCEYCRHLEQRVVSGKKTLNLYGSIRDAEKAYLDATAFVSFYDELQKILPKVGGDEHKKLQELITALSYTRLEIARRYAFGSWGCAERKGGKLYIRPEVMRWREFLSLWEESPAIKKINESGLPIETYMDEWQRYVVDGQNLLLGWVVRPVSPPDEGYTDLSILTDGIQGLPGSYHYGWHISSRDLEIEIPVEQATGASSFRMVFLQDLRHRIRAPRCVEIWIDGMLYQEIIPKTDTVGRVFIAEGHVDLRKTRTIRVKAVKPSGERSQVAVSEVYLIP